MATLTGSTGADSLVGGGANDVFDLFQGGNDTAEGRGGDDRFNFGAGFGAGDRVDGGLDTQPEEGPRPYDSLWLDGDYSAGLIITPDMLARVETIDLAAGGTYDITVADGVAPVAGLFVSAHGPVAFDASAETDTAIELTPGADGFDFAGGGGNDTVIVTSLLATDRMVGGGGADFLSIRSDGVFRFYDHTLSGVEKILVRTTAGASLILADGNTAAGGLLNVDNQASSAGIRVDGHREKDGRLQLTGNVAYADTLIGGKGADILQGRGGADRITGGQGADLIDFYVAGGGGTVLFLSRKDSPVGDGDILRGANAGDVIDLSAIDADKKTAGDQAFTLVEVFSGAAGEAVISYDEGSGVTQLLLELNGKPGAEMEVSLTARFLEPPIDYTGFAGFVF
jgi:Ca2+-binding RTX toxin-like protein